MYMYGKIVADFKYELSLVGTFWRVFVDKKHLQCGKYVFECVN